MPRLLAVVVHSALLLFPSVAVYAQNYDILENSAGTSIYLETDFEGNEYLPDCDWYMLASEFLSAEPANGYGTNCRVNFRIRGVIDREGAALFSAVVERASELDFDAASIVLDSRGGDADAAIAIARLIRRSDLFSRRPVVARIAEDYQSVCFSACVVIFSAAYERELDFNIDNDPRLPSRIGIHGPGQFNRGRSTYDSSTGNTEIARVNRRLKEYFRSIDVNDALVDDMFAVPFDQIRLLTRDELVSYGLYDN